MQKWLDLKDNPLNEGLKKAAGDCFNEAECKKCARNVIAFMKLVQVEEERRRQILQKKRKGSLFFFLLPQFPFQSKTV